MIRRTPLKRSPLKHPVALDYRAGGPFADSGDGPEWSTAVRKKRAKPRRVSVLRDPEYLAFLRERSCVACVIVRDEATRWEKLPPPMPCLSDPAHGPVNGRGSKGADNEAVPLCRAHHQLQHAMGWPRFEKEYGFSREKEAAAHWTAFQFTKETVNPPPSSGTAASS